MNKTLITSAFMLLAMLLSCEKEPEKDIYFPVTGIYGENILSTDSIPIQASNYSMHISYSMRAELPDGASLKIIMKKTGGIGGVWSYDMNTKTGWSINDFSGVQQQFVSYGPGVSEVAIHFFEIGIASIEIYENGSEEPFRIKSISWGEEK
jgi:hypothetical protein